MQLSRRWLDWQPSQDSSPISKRKGLTKLTKSPASGVDTGAGQYFVNSVSACGGHRDSLAEVQASPASQSANDIFSPPEMPPGVKLVSWEPLPAPVQVSPCSTVTDIDRFIRSTLLQLKAAMEGQSWLSGNWGLSGLLDRLEACGCVVVLDDPRRMLQ